MQTKAVHGSTSRHILDLSYDSRIVREGALYFALPGATYRGSDYIDDAIDRGAVAVVARPDTRPRKKICHIHVDDPRLAMAQAAAAFHQHPSLSLATIGLTGTNGKTTTSFIIRGILAEAGLRPGLIGTIQYEIGQRCIPAQRTTPESVDLQRMLAEMVGAGCQSAILEVSSHGLDQQRVEQVTFRTAVFTNLSTDHMDYHGDHEHYFNAKKSFFTRYLDPAKQPWAVLNIDDPHGKLLLDDLPDGIQCLTYAIEQPAEIRASDIELSADKTSFSLSTPWGQAPVEINMLGRFNIYNTLAAVGACGTLTVPFDQMVKVLNHLSPVPGRLESVANDRGLNIFVDYAHTEDALRKVLEILVEIRTHRLIVVFGCGGDRDPGKRPSMGRVASELADVSILTTDNPRSEEPEEIIKQIASGVNEHHTREMITNRKAAMARALDIAETGDILLVAGKGHEGIQQFRHGVILFDDRDVMRELLRDH